MDTPILRASARAYRAITVLQQGCDNIVLPAELPSCQLIMAVASACKFLP
jgi:hypothetical protein